tara:strand:+ start:4778 stop:5398 length:621 start_codon:yes stop_codon:yes gene_type:complete
MDQDRLDNIFTKKLYFTLCDYGEKGLAFTECDPESSEPIETSLKKQAGGVYPAKILKIIEVDLSSNTVKDVSAELSQKASVKLAQPTTLTNRDMLKLTDHIDLYFTLNDFGGLGVAFLEMDPSIDYKKNIVDNLHSTEIEKPLAVLKINLSEKSVQNISSDIAQDWFSRLEKDVEQGDLWSQPAICESRIPEFIRKNHPNKNKLVL